MNTPTFAPLRVDFAGGWLDVPRLARPGGLIVNCAIKPLVSLETWPYYQRSGLGGSAAYHLLSGRDPLSEELAIAGWQDAAVIIETGLCVWASGPRPRLVSKSDPCWLEGLMAIQWTGATHDTATVAGKSRNYEVIQSAGYRAERAVRSMSIIDLADSVMISYSAQLKEGMPRIEDNNGALASKYLGSGWGGYILHLFHKREARDKSGFLPIEPYTNSPR